jgi:hypothetical protein
MTAKTKAKAKAMVDSFDNDIRTEADSLRDDNQKAEAIVTPFGNDNRKSNVTPFGKKAKQLPPRLRGLSTPPRTVRLPIASIEMTHLCNQVSSRIFSWSE